jgi:adenylate cyclase
MGVNTGYCTVGNFGSEDRMDYTIVGGPVNVASRLESIAEPDQILIAHETYSLVKDEIYCRPVGDITVKGVSHPLRTYEVVDLIDRVRRTSSPIRAAAGGFNLELDPSALEEGEVGAARRALEEALAALDDE